MFKTRLKKRSNIQIVPMIDVIFFLLIFFMLFTTFRITPEGLDLRLPQATTVTGQEDESVIIAITKNNEFYLDGDMMGLLQIREHIQRFIQDNADLVVIIKADEEVQYKYVVEVMDHVRMVGAYRIALACDRRIQ